MFAGQSSKFANGCTNLLKMVKLNRFAKGVYQSNHQNQTNINMIDLSNKEVLQFLKSLYDHKVRYMLVGGVATVFHGQIRTTQYLDLWIQDTPENRKSLTKVLIDMQVPGASHYEKVDLVPGWSTINIGKQGFVADLMSYTKVFGKPDFEDCFKRARKGEFTGVPITVIAKTDLIREKEALARPKDLEDVENLRKNY